jgi:sugar lactone lactonase YvrE
LLSHKGDEVKEFAPTLPKKIPNGVCFSKDGFLYITDRDIEDLAAYFSAIEIKVVKIPSE